MGSECEMVEDGVDVEEWRCGRRGRTRMLKEKEEGVGVSIKGERAGGGGGGGGGMAGNYELGAKDEEGA